MSDKLPGYGKIYRLGAKETENVFCGRVSVQEKIDGSQISFGLVDGALSIRSRKTDLTDGSNSQFALAIAQIRINCHRYSAANGPLEGIFRGEFLRAPKHNRIKYDRVPEGNIVLFDGSKDGARFDPAYIQTCAEQLGFEPVRELYRGLGMNCPDLATLTSGESQLGGPMEGCVIKSLDNGMRAKYIREDFEATVAPRVKIDKTEGIDSIVDALNVGARWSKAVQHLRDEDLLIDSSTDIGLLIRELHRDFQEECEDVCKELLYAKYKKQILKGLTHGFSDWYHARLRNER